MDPFLLNDVVLVCLEPVTASYLHTMRKAILKTN